MLGQEQSRRLASGTWHILRTSLPFWRKRAAPAVSYAPLPTGEVGDIVTWRGRRPGRVVGIDRPGADGEWEWRGVEPLTLFLRSRWRFTAADEETGWAITHFERTLFTPAGVDLYARSPNLGGDGLAAALAACAGDPRTAEHHVNLFTPPR